MGCCRCSTEVVSQRAQQSVRASAAAAHRPSFRCCIRCRRRRARTWRCRCRAIASRASVRESWAAPSGTARRTIRRATRSSSARTIGAARCSSSAKRRQCRGSARRGSAMRRVDSAWTRRATAKGWLTAFDAENGRGSMEVRRAEARARRRHADGRRARVRRGPRRHRLRVRRRRWARAVADVDRSVDGRRIVSYLAGGQQRIGVAAGMRSPIWPGGSQSSHIIVYGIR